MRDLYRIIEECQKRKMMCRMAWFPGGYVNVAIYDSEAETEQHLYEQADGNLAELEDKIKKDFGHFLVPMVRTGMPLPPGFK